MNKTHKFHLISPMTFRISSLAALSLLTLGIVVKPLSLKAQQSSQSTALPDAPSAQTQTYAPKAPYTAVQDLTFRDRVRIYRQTLIRPYSVVGPAFGAGIGQAENEPPAWGQGGEGYAKRFASGMARQTISETIRFGVAAADGEDPRYHLSGETGFWPRTKHVIVESFTSETAGGRRIPAYSRFAGTYGAAFISNTWYPDNRATAGYALRRGSTAFASSIGFHMFEEFMPRKYFQKLGIGGTVESQR
jgi:hypothetical protein